MVKYFAANIILIACLISINSCSDLKIYTSSVDGRLTGQQVRKIQFYNSKEILLRREIQKGETGVSKGEIHLIDGKYYQIIEVPKLTPGVCLDRGGYIDYNESWPAKIAFDSTERTLEFIPTSLKQKYFYLNYTYNTGDKYPHMIFDGKQFDILMGAQNTLTKLLVKKDKKKQSRQTKEVLKGRSIEQ